jgi:hypothetical protein
MVFASAQAAVLQVDAGGILTGATGVVVNGSLYDVSFVDGSCVGLFGGCDQVSDFDFQTSADALAASQALLDSVLIDTGSYMFDTHWWLVSGCGTTAYPCGVFTPYSPSSSPYTVLTSVAVNYSSDSVSLSSLSRSDDTSSATSYVYAKWTPVSPVPEPETYVMLLAGLGFIGFMTLRRKQNFAT